MSTKATTHQTGALLAYRRLLTAMFRRRRIPTEITSVRTARRQSLQFGYCGQSIDPRVIRQDDINTTPRRWGMRVLPVP